MGQYFKAVNTNKQEYVCPWCIGGGAKLWEWAANTQGSIFTLLLRKSSATGGGDFGGPAQQLIELNDTTSFSDVLAKAVAQEGEEISTPPESIVGRWAGDPVFLVGDYDDSGLYELSKSYRTFLPNLLTNGIGLSNSMTGNSGTILAAVNPAKISLAPLVTQTDGAFLMRCRMYWAAEGRRGPFQVMNDIRSDERLRVVPDAVDWDTNISENAEDSHNGTPRNGPRQTGSDWRLVPFVAA